MRNGFTTTRRGAIALALALAGATFTIGCDELVADGRLQSCGANLPGNRVLATHEIPAIELSNRFGVDRIAHPEVLSDQLVFVVVFAGPAVLPVRHGENVINRMHYQAICVWFGDGNVAVYEGVITGDPEEPVFVP